MDDRCKTEAEGGGRKNPHDRRGHHQHVRQGGQARNAKWNENLTKLPAEFWQHEELTGGRRVLRVERRVNVLDRRHGYRRWSDRNLPDQRTVVTSVVAPPTPKLVAVTPLVRSVDRIRPEGVVAARASGEVTPQSPAKKYGSASSRDETRIYKPEKSKSDRKSQDAVRETAAIRETFRFPILEIIGSHIWQGIVRLRKNSKPATVSTPVQKPEPQIDDVPPLPPGHDSAKLADQSTDQPAVH